MAAPAVDIPKVCISPGFTMTIPERLERHGIPPSVLSYLFLIQGKNASERTRVIARPTRDAAAAAMLHEVMNGFSIVFSGAVLSSSMGRIFPKTPSVGRWTFVKVGDARGLNDAMPVRDSRGQASVVGVWC